MAYRFRLISILTLLLASAPSMALAESGRLHLSTDVSLGGAIAGASASQAGQRAHSLGGVFGLSLDWQFRPPFALEGQFQIGGFNSSFASSGLEGTLLASFSFGMRFRFFDDQGGYISERGGNLKGHLWVAPHIGFYTFDAGQYGFDVSAGYAMSIHRPMVLSPFVRANLLFAGHNDGPDMVLLGGIQATVELIRRSEVQDLDGDGLSNTEETRLGTDLHAADTDHDGVTDPVEVRTGTDPNVADTDRDGLEDGFEDENGNGRMDLEETDPREADTDRGGVSDGDEIRVFHTDPRLRADDTRTQPTTTTTTTPAHATPAPAPAQILSVAFAAGRTRLAPAGEQVLATLAATLRADEVPTEIELFVQPSGDAAADAQLAQRRADAISTWLAQHDVARTRYVLRAAGADPDAARTSSPTAATLAVTRH